MPTILLIRHAEAEGNAEGRFIGQEDVPLTEHGRRQAADLTRRLRHLPILHIASSDLSRCVETMQPLAEDLGLEITTDRRLREIANGEWGGLLPSEIEERWPDLFRRYRAGEDVARPGGETWQIVSRRVTAALEELAGELGPDGMAAVGTHAGPIGVAARWAAGLPTARSEPRRGFGIVDNTAVSVLHFPGPRLTGYNHHPAQPGAASVG